MNKQRFRKLVIAFIGTIVLLTYTGVVAYASVQSYINWAGSQDYTEATDNISQLGGLLDSNRTTINSQEQELQSKGSELSTLRVELGDLEVEIASLNSIIQFLEDLLNPFSQNEDITKALEETIGLLESTEQSLEAVQGEVNILETELEAERNAKTQLESNISDKDAQLRQAEIDMQEINSQTESLLQEYNDESGE